MKELVAYFSITGTTKKKEVVLFATSGGSGWGETLEFIKPSVDKSCKISLGKINSLDGI